MKARDELLADAIRLWLTNESMRFGGLKEQSTIDYVKKSVDELCKLDDYALQCRVEGLQKEIAEKVSADH